VSANNSVGIKSFGCYLPARRMSRAAIAEANAWAFPSMKSLGKGEKTLCGWDEDVITMSVEAGRDCLRGQRLSSIASLDLASTTAPYADLQNAVITGYALRLPRATSAADHSGSTRAGLSALARACQSGPSAERLLIAADKRTGKPGSAQEFLYGSGAGAILIGAGAQDLIAGFLGSESVSVPFVDHFRHGGEKFDYFWEERWIRDEGVSKIVPGAVTSLLKREGIDIARVKHFGLAGGPTGSDKLVAKAAGIDAAAILPDLQGQVGDTGAAQSVLLLIEALERAQPGDVIVIASFAQGCEVVAFEMLNKPAPGSRRGLSGTLAHRIVETAYTKMLSFEDNLELDWGMRSESDQKTPLTQSYRSADQILGFVGGRCKQCEAVQFPRLPGCVNCGAVNSQTPYSLADEPGQVATFTADWLQYSPSPPLYVGLVQFDVGARLLMEMVDVGPEGIDVGSRLEMRFRIKERDKLRHYDRYFWKASPVY
jgi:3-hydroxy-3-methylglutaryl CoA synthase